VNQKGRRISREDATDVRLGGPAGPEAEWAARSAGPKIRKKEFLN
jgi:hypothetical protein